MEVSKETVMVGGVEYVPKSSVNINPIDIEGEFYSIGKSYYVRTVTHHYVGKLVGLNENEMLLENASWVADSGRWHDALKNGTLDEVEPFVNPVVVNRRALCDATEWSHNLPSVQK